MPFHSQTIHDVIKQAAEAAVCRWSGLKRNKDGVPIRTALLWAMEQVIDRKCDKIIRAATVKQSARQRAEDLENHRREKARITRDATDRMRGIAALTKRLQACNAVAEYPPVPLPFGLHPVPEDQIPTTSGVYLAFASGLCAYVGQSINLRNRLSPAHEKLRTGDSIAWIGFPSQALNFAECYYIGIMRPFRNFRWTG